MLHKKISGEWTACLLLMVVTIIGAQMAIPGVAWGWGLGLLLVGYALRNGSEELRRTAITAAYITFGYRMYSVLGDYIKEWLADDMGLAVGLSRLSLIAFILPMAIFSCVQKSKPRYIAVGKWSNPIYFPWIVRGLYKEPIWRFILIFTAVTGVVFAFIIDWGRPGLIALTGYALLFASVNAVLEELLWRGYILSRLTEDFGEIRGLVIAGAAFGFYHLHLGFPWIVCLLFSFFGMMMSGVAIRAQGLVPVITMHFVMNMWFVLSGMIL